MPPLTHPFFAHSQPSFSLAFLRVLEKAYKWQPYWQTFVAATHTSSDVQHFRSSYCRTCKGLHDQSPKDSFDAYGIPGPTILQYFRKVKKCRAWTRFFFSATTAFQGVGEEVYCMARCSLPAGTVACRMPPGALGQHAQEEQMLHPFEKMQCELSHSVGLQEQGGVEERPCPILRNISGCNSAL